MNNDIRNQMENIHLVDKPILGFSLIESMTGLLRVMIFLFMSGFAIKMAKSLYAAGDVGLTILSAIVALTTLVLGLGHLGICVFSRFSIDRRQGSDAALPRSTLGMVYMVALYLTLLVVFSSLAWQLAKWSWNLL